MSHLNMSANLKQITQAVHHLQGNRSALLEQATAARKVAEMLSTCAPTKYGIPKDDAGAELVAWASEAVDILETAANQIDSILNRQKEDG